MNWSALTKRQQQMAVATIIMAVAQIFLMVHFLGWTKPASERGGAGKKELLELEKKLDEARTMLRREAAVRGELSQSVEQLEALKVYTPSSSDRYAWAYEYASHCATQAKVELDSLEESIFTGDAKNADSQPYEISISTQCGYNSLVEFLNRLEKGNPLLRIKDVTVSSLPSQPQSHQVRIIMQWPAAVKVEKGAR